MYLEKYLEKDYKGTKPIKNRLTAMIFTAAYGTRIPIELIGKANNLLCFKFIINDKINMLLYHYHKNAWFDWKISMWWIMNVFCPRYNKHHVLSLLLLVAVSESSKDSLFRLTINRGNYIN